MAIHLIVLMCALSHSGFGGSRVAVSLYALEQGASQFTIGVLMALYAASRPFPGPTRSPRGPRRPRATQPRKSVPEGPIKGNAS